MKASIFDYHSEPSSPSVTPPLPPLSVSNSDYSSERSSPQISPQSTVVCPYFNFDRFSL
jgi:hypothetical protein